MVVYATCHVTAARPGRNNKTGNSESPQPVLVAGGHIDWWNGGRVRATCSKSPPHSSKLITRSVFFHAGLDVTAAYTESRNASPLRMSANGWSSFERPCDSPRKRGSTNDTCGKVPAAQSAKNCAVGALMD